MTKREFEAGAAWAYRAPNSAGRPAVKVVLLFLPNRKGAVKVKVRHVEGELVGLEEFVPATRLVCRWEDWPKLERDEQKEAAFYSSLEHREEIDPVIYRAASAVLSASGEDLMVDDFRPYSVMNKAGVAALDRVTSRASLDDRPWRGSPCYTNRKGSTHVPNDLLVDLALAFAKAEPQTVILYLDLEEAEYLRKGYGDSRFWHRELLKELPAHAIARHWSSGAERDPLRDELERVRQLAQRACYHLKEAGQERKADSLLRQL